MNEPVLEKGHREDSSRISRVPKGLSTGEVQYYDGDSVLYAVRGRLVTALNDQCVWEPVVRGATIQIPEDLERKTLPIDFSRVKEIVEANDDQYSGEVKPL